MLILKNVKKIFNNNSAFEKTLYESLNLTIKKGDFVTILGSNGAGKSTLFKLINNTLKAENGSIHLNNDNIINIEAHKVSNRISTVVQDPKVGTIGSMTVFENLSMAELKGKKLSLRFCINKKKLTEYKSLLKQFDLGLENKMDHKVSSLSGGQRQVLSLLMATLHTPKLLLLDEHTAALDPKTSEKVMTITQNIVDDKNLTCMMITHKLDDALNFGNRLIMIHEGEILLDINREEKSQMTINSLLDKYRNVKSTLSDRQLFS